MILMPEYGRYQVVQALQIARVDWKKLKDKVIIEFTDDHFSPLCLTRTEAAKMQPNAGDYLVKDDYCRISCIKGDEFERTFKQISF